jgi:serine/threonine-protein kinase PpkA
MHRLILLLVSGLAWVVIPTASWSGGADVLEAGPGPAVVAAPPDAGPDSLESGPATDEPGVRCEGKGPCLELGTGLALRVLPRPLSHIYRNPQEQPDAIVQANVRAFHPLYVYARQGVDLSDPGAPKGWYQVGAGLQAPQGWMRAADVLEWRQALLVSYTHPGGVSEGRKPVLMFRDLAALKRLVEAPDRVAQAEALYQRVEAKDIPDELVSMEPKRFVDITRQFYILPIVRFDTTTLDGDDVRYLQIAAAVPGRRGADTLQNADYRDQADQSRDAADTAAVKNLKVDVVFVLDTTRSTQPYIDATKAAVAAIVRRMSNPELAGRIHFGLVGYRDSLAKIPAIEYTARNFTPELVDAEALVKLLDGQVKATPVGSLDYAEEVFAGMDLALRSKWEPGALRFVVLVGDASSHPKGHAQNTTGKDEKDLRLEADDAQVHVFAIHLKDARAAEDHPLAEEQFSVLARIRGSNESAVYEVDAFQEGGFQRVVETVTGKILDRLGGALSAKNGAQMLPPPPPMPDFSGDPTQQAGALVDKLWEAALVEYIGKAAEPPKDVIAWTVDRDLLNPVDRALAVRVLITRAQLSSLVQALDQVVQAFMKAEVTQSQFFDALQAVSGQTLKRPEDIGKSMRLAESGLLPAFISSLPYKSDVLALSNEMYASMSAEQRSALEWSLLTKLQQYRAINEQVDAWTRLNEGDPDSEMVYPMHLDYMP